MLHGVDLLLHAGDVDELWVLDQLSSIAPVVAVHGNDETVNAQRELPYQQLIVINGQRILLTHAHYPDRDEELASRRIDASQPKLEHWAAMGRRARASIVAFGHTHIPMAHRYGDVLLVNPGAIASSNYMTRQTVRTVAVLFLRDDDTAFVAHVDLAHPEQRFEPKIDWQAGFASAPRQYLCGRAHSDKAAKRLWRCTRKRDATSRGICADCCCEPSLRLTRRATKLRRQCAG